MAYPKQLPLKGPLSTTDIFQWWKDAFKDNSPIELFDDSIWRDLIKPDFPKFPITRGQYYDWLDTWFGKTGTVSNYTFESVNPNWTHSQAIWWGRMLTWELAIFGNLKYGNGRSETSLPEYTASDTNMGVDKWEKHSISLLRYAFANFTDYGSCLQDHDFNVLLDFDLDIPYETQAIPAIIDSMNITHDSSSGNNLFFVEVSCDLKQIVTTIVRIGVEIYCVATSSDISIPPSGFLTYTGELTVNVGSRIGTGTIIIDDGPSLWIDSIAGSRIIYINPSKFTKNDEDIIIEF